MLVFHLNSENLICFARVFALKASEPFCPKMHQQPGLSGGYMMVRKQTQIICFFLPIRASKAPKLQVKHSPLPPFF